MATTQIKIDNMHCTACAIRIDGDLEETVGVKSATTNYAQGFTQIEYDESSISTEQLKEVIRKAGYNTI